MCVSIPPVMLHNNNNNDNDEMVAMAVLVVVLCAVRFSAHHHDLKNIIGKSTLYGACVQVLPNNQFCNRCGGVLCVCVFRRAGVKTFAYIASGVCFRIFISLILIHLCACECARVSVCLYGCARNFTIYHSFNHSSYSTIMCPKYLILLYVCYEVHKLLHRNRTVRVA